MASEAEPARLSQEQEKVKVKSKPEWSEDTRRQQETLGRGAGGELMDSMLKKI